MKDQPQPLDLGKLDERGQRILVTATRLILHYGYDKTTMSDIAAAANVSKSTLYLYWQSKEELLRALLARETLGVVNDWLQRVQDDPQGGTLFGIYQHGFRALVAHPLMSALYTKESHVLGEYVRRRDPARHVLPYELNRLLVQRLQAAGLIRPDVSDAVLNHLLMLISVGLFSIGELLPAEEVPPLEEVLDELARMVARSLSPDEPGDPRQGKLALQEFLAQLISAFVRS
ncbi:TetR/AcrR family transcriptional regulator [Ktedonosporobacter rubrisoli]|uniref:TetR/AcrR family transcriptional regulator n=1 Tax=Ktedonosporobacter rubrisoli TaxID=2509675 RepID=A0A4P6JIU8_KTERU|nr:TetR/AcrR family transcriptional regulator [Ktedonosporobacter rubrisoli]QBD74999.1 TetR/AcrR family transcriptional regulator [Ktedonosporobacter rubrisoli]